MKTSMALSVLAALLVSGSAWADGGTSCATAQEIFSNQTYSGDTSTSTSFIGSFAGVPSPGPDLAFKFTAGIPAGPIVVFITGGWNAGGVITASCAPIAGPPLDAATGTTSFPVPTTGLANGTLYYFIMTGNPSDNSGPSGTFSFVTPFFPVSLQTFFVE